jgi:leucyl/phenylalanyl-tRNA---protein transferase
VESANELGILASGGNLSPGMLLSAYKQGIFPWFSEGEPLLWWSPDPRFVLLPDQIHCPASLRKFLRKGRFELSLDKAFRAVISSCSRTRRPRQDGTWITDEMVEAYCDLHELGYAHSVEVWAKAPDGDKALVGGLYGVSLGRVFFGESMFSLEDNASKSGFIPLAWRLREEGFLLIDSQVHTDYVESLGGREIPRDEYLGRLAMALAAPTRRGDWSRLFPGFPDSQAYRAVMAGGAPD